MIDHMNPLVPFMDCAEFCAQRATILPEIIALKKQRSVALGPDMTLLFEHPTLVWWQIQEMVRIETQTPEQWMEEWEVYRHLLPSADRLTATLTIEIADPVKRKRALHQRVGIENMICLEGAGYRLVSTPVDTSPLVMSSEADRTRHHTSTTTSTTRDKDEEDKSAIVPEKAPQEALTQGLTPDKTCAVQFLAFTLTPHTRKILTSAPPVVSCLHSHALARVSMGGELWSSIVHDLGGSAD